MQRREARVTQAQESVPRPPAGLAGGGSESHRHLWGNPTPLRDSSYTRTTFTWGPQCVPRKAQERRGALGVQDPSCSSPAPCPETEALSSPRPTFPACARPQGSSQQGSGGRSLGEDSAQCSLLGWETEAQKVTGTGQGLRRAWDVQPRTPATSCDFP